MHEAPHYEEFLQDSVLAGASTDPETKAKIARLEQLGIRPAITVYKEPQDHPGSST
ncbi:MAG: hypothetical protein H6Q75_91 [Firmicutes bacterium]|nr:hypothetical protein [Bacillota bacterium]